MNLIPIQSKSDHDLTIRSAFAMVWTDIFIKATRVVGGSSALLILLDRLQGRHHFADPAISEAVEYRRLNVTTV